MMLIEESLSDESLAKRVPNPLHRRIGRLADRLIQCRAAGMADDAFRSEDELHALLLAEAPGVVFDMGGLAIRADGHTPAGKVEITEMVEL